MKPCVFSGLFRDRTVEEAFRLAKRLGAEGIELRCHVSHVRLEDGEKDIERLAALSKRHELPIVGIYGCFFGGFSTRETEEECLAQERIIAQIIAHAKGVGACHVSVGCGGPNAFLAMDAHYERAAFWLSRSADLAAKQGLDLLLEIHNISLVETPRDAMRLVDAIDRPNVGLIHDAGNMYITDTDYGLDALRVLGKRLRHVHIKDITRLAAPGDPDAFENLTHFGQERFRLMGLNEGQVDHMKVLRGLAQQGYKGYLSLECNVAMDDIARATHEMRELRRMLALCNA